MAERPTTVSCDLGWINVAISDIVPPGGVSSPRLNKPCAGCLLYRDESPKFPLRPRIAAMPTADLRSRAAPVPTIVECTPVKT